MAWVPLESNPEVSDLFAESQYVSFDRRLNHGLCFRLWRRWATQRSVNQSCLNDVYNVVHDDSLINDTFLAKKIIRANFLAVTLGCEKVQCLWCIFL